MRISGTVLKRLKFKLFGQFVDHLRFPSTEIFHQRHQRERNTNTFRLEKFEHIGVSYLQSLSKNGKRMKQKEKYAFFQIVTALNASNFE